MISPGRTIARNVREREGQRLIGGVGIAETIVGIGSKSVSELQRIETQQQLCAYTNFYKFGVSLAVGASPASGGEGFGVPLLDDC
jgi:hypothetical protein